VKGEFGTRINSCRPLFVPLRSGALNNTAPALVPFVKLGTHSLLALRVAVPSSKECSSRSTLSSRALVRLRKIERRGSLHQKNAFLCGLYCDCNRNSRGNGVFLHCALCPKIKNCDIRMKNKEDEDASRTLRVFVFCFNSPKERASWFTPSKKRLSMRIILRQQSKFA